MNQTLAKLPLTIALVAACALSTSAFAQSDANKHALAVKLAQLQQKAYGDVITQQLINSAEQPLVEHWSQQLKQTVPPARQAEVGQKLDVELKKFTAALEPAIQAQLAKSAESALVPVYMDKLTEDEMKTIITYLESPVSTKFDQLELDASTAWAKSIVTATQAVEQSSASSFDAAASQIVSAAASPSSGSSASAPKAKAKAKK